MADMSEKRFLMPLFTWRSAIASANGPKSPTTRLVLLTLGLHMSERGESCYPSTKTLSEETGLSEKAVITHLQIAEETGWIRKGQHGFSNQKWKRHEYFPTFPNGTEGRSAPLEEKGTERGSAPSEKARNVVPKGTERRSVEYFSEYSSTTTQQNARVIPAEVVEQLNTSNLPEIPEQPNRHSHFCNFFMRKGYPMDRVVTPKFIKIFRDWCGRGITLTMLRDACESAEAYNNGPPATIDLYVRFLESMEREMAKPGMAAIPVGKGTSHSSAPGGNKHGKFGERDYQAGATPVEDLDWLQDESV